MAERIGNVVYWFCCIVAAICFAFGFSVWFLNFTEGTEAYSLLAVSFYGRVSLAELSATF
jgi:hypothetical protein